VAALADALIAIASDPAGEGAAAPRTTPVGRVDEALAARRLLPTWDAVVGDPSASQP
jgi:hypothetical protein